MLSFMPKSWATAALVLAFAVTPGRAEAQANATDKAAAEALFQEGRALFQQGQYEQACAKFSASQQLDGGFGTLMNLGECFEKRKLTASAWATFTEAAGLARTLGQADREASARARAAALSPKLPKLVVRAADAIASIPGLEVRLNGTPLPRAVWGSAVPVDPGEQRVEVTAPGYRPFTRALAVPDGAGESTLEIAALEPIAPVASSPASTPTAATPAPSPVPPPPPDTSSAGNTQRTIGYLVGGAGIAAAVAGSIFGARAIGKNSDSQDFCRPDNEKLCSSQGLALRDDARSAAKISTVTFVASGVLLAAGITLVLTAPSSSEAAPSASARARRAARGPLARLDLVSFVAPTSASLGLRGDF